MKPKNKKDPKTEFQSDASDAEFKNLMRKIGVKELENSVVEPKSQPPKKGNEPINFVENNKENFILRPAEPDRKYSKSPKDTPLAHQRKRKKITPGFIPDVEIDLHGCTRDKALSRVERLMKASRAKKCKSVLIITGRGLNSEKDEGVLRKAVWNWLKRNQDQLNINSKWAPFFLGGKGAILVFFN